MTRRGFIAGATAMAAGLAMSGVVKSAAAARSTIFSNSTDEEEEMYKEMFKALVCNVPSGETVRIYDLDVTYVGPGFLRDRRWTSSGSMGTGMIEIDFPNCIQIGVGSLGSCMQGCNLVSVNLPKLERVYGNSNFQDNRCVEIYLPSLTMFGNHEFSYSPTLKTLRLPSVTSKSGSFFVYQCSALEDVYLPQMTLAQLGGASYIAQQNCNSAAVFHLQDGDYDYQGSPLT